MTWRDRQQWGVTSEDRAQYRRARFKNVPFWVDMYELDNGRRQAIQRFPGDRYTNVQELGEDAGKYSITALFIGDNYDLDRAAFEAALLETNAGVLELPWRDPVTVTVVGRWQTQETKQRRGFCTIKFKCIETETPPEQYTRLPAPRVRIAGVNLKKIEKSKFEQAFDKVTFFSPGQRSKVADFMKGGIAVMSDAQQTIDSKIGQIDRYANRISRLFGNVNSIINLPLELSDTIIDAVTTVYSSVKGSVALAENVVLTWGRGGPMRYMAEVTFGYGETFTDPTAGTSTFIENATVEAMRAARRFMFMSMLSEFLLSIEQAPFESYEQASEVLSSWYSAVDDLMSDSDDDQYHALQAANNAMGEYVRSFLDGLPHVSEYEPRVDTSALIVSQTLYGTADFDLEIEARNGIDGIDNPALIPGGTTLEVVNAK